VINGAIDRVERRSDGTVVIVDLKTGKTAVPGPEVPGHAQLSAYQLAHREGAIPNDSPLGGAKLVFISPEVANLKSKRYREVVQQAKTEDEFEAFRVRVQEAGRGMAGAEFIGVRADNGRDGYDYRIHLVPEVSEAGE
jgi:RecB family exonuclease